MKSVLVALCGLIPGFAHGLMSQRRMMWIIFASAYVAASVITVTVWAAWLAFAIVVSSVVHAGLLHRRLGATVRWSWLDPLLAFVGVIVLNITMRVFVVEAFKSPSSSMTPTLELGDHFFINKLWGSPSRGDVIVFRHPCDADKDYVKRVIAIGGDTIEVRCSVVYLNGNAVPRETIEDGTTCRYEDRQDLPGRNESYWVSCSRYRETLDGVAFEIFQDPDQPSRDGTARSDAKDFPTETVLRSCADQGTSSQPPVKLVVTKNEPATRCEPYMHIVVPPDALFVLGDNRANSNDSRYWGVVPASYVKGRVTGRWLPISRFGAL